MKRLMMAALVTVVLVGCGQKRRKITQAEYHKASQLRRDAEMSGAEAKHMVRQFEANPNSSHHEQQAVRALHNYARSVKRMRDYDKQFTK